MKLYWQTTTHTGRTHNKTHEEEHLVCRAERIFSLHYWTVHVIKACHFNKWTKLPCSNINNQSEALRRIDLHAGGTLFHNLRKQILHVKGQNFKTFPSDTDLVKITSTAYRENITIRNADGSQQINVIQFKQFRNNMLTLKNHFGFFFNKEILNDSFRQARCQSLWRTQHGGFCFHLVNLHWEYSNLIYTINAPNVFFVDEQEKKRVSLHQRYEFCVSFSPSLGRLHCAWKKLGYAFKS